MTIDHWQPLHWDNLAILNERSMLGILVWKSLWYVESKWKSLCGVKIAFWNEVVNAELPQANQLPLFASNNPCIQRGYECPEPFYTCYRIQYVVKHQYSRGMHVVQPQTFLHIWVEWAPQRSNYRRWQSIIYIALNPLISMYWEHLNEYKIWIQHRAKKYIKVGLKSTMWSMKK